MSPTRLGLAWVWHAPTPVPELRVAVPLPHGASYVVDIADPWTPIGWELPPGVDPDVFAVAFGTPWSTQLRAKLRENDSAPVDPPPPVSDGWARVAVVRAVAGNHVVTFDDELTALDEALAWAQAGQDEMAALRLRDGLDALEDVVDQAGRRLAPLACISEIRAVCELGERLGIRVPHWRDLVGTDLDERVDDTSADLVDSDATGDPRQAWVRNRLAGAAVASGGAKLVEELHTTGGLDVPPSVSVLRPLVAEVLLVHGLPQTLEDEPHPGPPAEAALTLGDVVPEAAASASREQVQAALDVYRSFGLTDRVAECEALLAQLDARTKEPGAADLADLADLEQLVARWVFDFQVQALTEPLQAPAHRAVDSEPTATVRVVLDDAELFAELMGRPRSAAVDGWPTLTIRVDGHNVVVDLWLPGEPVQPVSSADVSVPTSAGVVLVHLEAVDALQLAGTSDLTQGAEVVGGSAEVRRVRHDH